ncbi:MAG: undecaprenyl-diphosphatase UppP [Chloroflexi bacterium]|nr:undecaprenyl-diphosphatase UppP [Chloroflexota bacterium]
MLDVLRALLMGFIQGVTEFWPISSTGHLILVEKGLGANEAQFGLAFDAVIHLGTLLAILAFFWRDILSLLAALVGSIARRNPVYSPQAQLAWLLLLATVPAVLMGILFEKPIEDSLRSPLVVAGMLAGFAPVLLAAERWGSQERGLTRTRLWDAIAMGAAQALALVPGVSRSGITISTGMFRGITREGAARFTFLLSIPIVAGAGGKKALDVLTGTEAGSEMKVLAVGFLAAAFFGYLAIRYLLRFLANHRLNVFAYYRIALAVAIVIVYVATR